jgi:hypothetical protein
MNTRGNLQYLTSMGVINRSVLVGISPDIPDFGEYLRNTSDYLSIFDPLDKLLLRPKWSVQSYYTPLFIRVLPVVGTKVNFFSFISIAKSFYHDVAGWSDNDYLQNQLLVDKMNSGLIMLVAP